MLRYCFIFHTSDHHHLDPPLEGHLEQGRSKGARLLVQAQSSAGKSFGLRTALNVQTCSVFSWEDSIPGCSSSCSGSHSCRTVVAGDQSQKKLNEKRCQAHLTVCIKIWVRTWYQLLYPAYPACAAAAAAASPPPTTGGGVVMGACGTADWASADASPLALSSALCIFSGSSSL